MKFPQIATYAAVLLCTYLTYSQSNSLATVPTTFYAEINVSSLSNALDTDEHQVLFKALKTVQLEKLLDMDGPFTVFAPTNQAFTMFSEKEWEALLKEENRKKLKDVLTYHIVAGELTASKILRALCRGEGKASFTTVQGTKVYASMRGTDIVLEDCFGNQAVITSADSREQNGIIHEIDGVILPSGI